MMNFKDYTISFNHNPTIWFKEINNTIKIASMNCAGLKAHYEDIIADKKLLNADIIFLQETSLPEDNSQDYSLSTHPYFIHVSLGKGRGIAAYTKIKWNQVKIEKTDTMQLLQLTYGEFRIVNIYRSSNCSQHVFCQYVIKYIEEEGPCTILGDFNICSRLQKKSTIANCFAKYGFNQLIKEPTHIRGRVIDQIHCRDDGKFTILDVERMSPYYSDHDALLLSLELKVLIIFI